MYSTRESCFVVSRSNNQTSTVASFHLRFFFLLLSLTSPLLIFIFPWSSFNISSCSHLSFPSFLSLSLPCSFLFPLFPTSLSYSFPASLFLSLSPFFLTHSITSRFHICHFPHFSHSLFISISYFFVISSPYYLPQARIYNEYYSVCPLVGIWTLPTPLSPASVPLPPEPGGGGGTLACG